MSDMSSWLWVLVVQILAKTKRDKLIEPSDGPTTHCDVRVTNPGRLR